MIYRNIFIDWQRKSRGKKFLNLQKFSIL